MFIDCLPKSLQNTEIALSELRKQLGMVCLQSKCYQHWPLYQQMLDRLYRGQYFMTPCIKMEKVRKGHFGARRFCQLYFKEGKKRKSRLNKREGTLGWSSGKLPVSSPVYTSL